MNLPYIDTRAPLPNGLAQRGDAPVDDGAVDAAERRIFSDPRRVVVDDSVTAYHDQQARPVDPLEKYRRQRRRAFMADRRQRR